MPPTTNKEKYKKYYTDDQFVDKPLEKFNCVQPYQRLTLRNEYMYPCCVSFNKELKLGSIREMSIYDAWNSEKMREIREIHKSGEYRKNKTCKDCVDLIYPTKSKFLN